MNLAGLTQYDVMVYGIVSAFLPGLIAIINRPHFPDWLRQVIMAAVALAAGFVTYGFKNGWDFKSAGLGAAMLGVWAATQLAYQYFWKKGLGPALEAKVLGGKKVDAPVSPPEDAFVDDEDPEEPVSYTDPIPEGRALGPADEGVPSAPVVAEPKVDTKNEDDYS